MRGMAERMKEFASWRTKAIVMVCLGIGILGLSLSSVFLKSGSMYSIAISEVRVDSEMKANFGEIKKTSFLITGSINPQSRSYLKFGVIGERGKGHVQIVLNKDEKGMIQVERMEILE